MNEHAVHHGTLRAPFADEDRHCWGQSLDSRFKLALLACRINGLTHINLTKLDVLDHLETIQLGTKYKVDGKELPSLPGDLSTLEAVEVEYEQIPGWQTDISKIRTWNELPENAIKYIARIEELVGVKCKWIGVGPGRDAIVVQP